MSARRPGDGPITTRDALDPTMARIDPATLRLDPPWVADVLLVGAVVYATLGVVGFGRGDGRMVLHGAPVSLVMLGSWMRTRLARSHPRAARLGGWLAWAAILGVIVAMVVRRL